MIDNSTTKLCLDFDRYNQIVRATFFLWRFFVVLTFFIGVPGHLFQIIVLLRRNYRKESTSTYLIAVSFCESIFLTGNLWYWSFNVGLIPIDPRQIFSCGIFYNFLAASTYLSNIYLALMCIDRSVMILWPIQYRIRISQPKILLRIVVVAILMIISLVPNNFYLHYDRKTTLFLCEFRSLIDRQRFWFWTIIHAIFFVSIPSVCVLIFSLILLFNRYKSHRRNRRTRSLAAIRMFNRSIFILFVSLALCLSAVPVCILQILIVQNRFFPDDSRCSRQWKIYRILLNCFLVLSSLNYSMKFYVHLIVSTSFRKQIFQLIRCQTKRKCSTSTQMKFYRDEKRSYPN